MTNNLDHLLFKDAALLAYARTYQDVSNDETLMWRYAEGFNWLYIKQESDYRGELLVSTHLKVSFTQGNERHTVGKIVYKCCVSCMVEEAFRLAKTIHEVMLPKKPLTPNPKSPWYSNDNHRAAT